MKKILSIAVLSLFALSGCGPSLSQIEANRANEEYWLNKKIRYDEEKERVKKDNDEIDEAVRQVSVHKYRWLEAAKIRAVELDDKTSAPMDIATIATKDTGNKQFRSEIYSILATTPVVYSAADDMVSKTERDIAENVAIFVLESRTSKNKKKGTAKKGMVIEF